MALLSIFLLCWLVLQATVKAWPTSTSDPVVRIAPADSAMEAGDAITVTVKIEEVANLGAFEFTLVYAPSIVQVTDVALGNFLGSSGRSVTSVGPITDDQAGKVKFGAFSFGDDRGPDGVGILASITLEAQGEGQAILDLKDVKAADIAGHPQAITVEDGRVSVGRLPEATPMETEAPQPTATSEATPMVKPVEATPRETEPPLPTATSEVTSTPVPSTRPSKAIPTDTQSSQPKPPPEATPTLAPPSEAAQVLSTTVPTARLIQVTPKETKASRSTAVALEETPAPMPPQLLVWGFLFACVLLGAFILLRRREAR